MVRANFSRQNQRRIDALEREDYPKYASLTDLLGVPPENQQAYEAGELELDLESKADENMLLQEQSTQKSNRKRSVSTVRYIGFLDEAEKMHPSTQNKREILARYFPGRFGKGKVDNMTDEKVYGVYQGIVRYAEQRAREAEE